MTVTREAFADQLAVGLGRPAGSPGYRDLVVALVTGMVAEDSTAHFNPLDTTEPYPGASDYNTVGVKNYPSFQAGVDATIKTLNNGDYGQVLSTVHLGAPAVVILHAFGASPWGGVGNYLWEQTLPRVEADFATLAGVAVAEPSAATPGPDPVPAATPLEEPAETPAVEHEETADEKEAVAVESAIVAQTQQIAADETAGKASAASQLLPRLKIHLQELVDLVTEALKQ